MVSINYYNPLVLEKHRIMEMNWFCSHHLKTENNSLYGLYNNGTNLVDVTLVDALRGNTEITLKPKSLNTIIYSNNPYN